MTKKDTITIEAAADGGFMAFGANDYGERHRLLFAGTLKEVLAYAEKRLSPPPEEVAQVEGGAGSITLPPEVAERLRAIMIEVPL